MVRPVCARHADGIVVPSFLVKLLDIVFLQARMQTNFFSLIRYESEAVHVARVLSPPVVHYMCRRMLSPRVSQVKPSKGRPSKGRPSKGRPSK